MKEFTIVERTEPLTLDEVFSFIDETNISKRDAHELKSRIADAVKGIREKVIDEFAEAIDKTLLNNHWDCLDMEDVRKIAEKLKGGAE